MDEALFEATLAGLVASRELDPDDPRFLRLEREAAHLRKAAKRKRRSKRRKAAADHDRALSSATRIGGERTLRPRNCYVCKQPYRALHPVYPRLCQACGDNSLAHRAFPVDLTGRRAMVTGGRIKIGFAVALQLLRSGAQVRVTSRFPADAARRYAAEPDATEWQDRLEIHGLDFRRLPAVLEAIERWRQEPLNILINNAAQTVWQPPRALAALVEAEHDSPFPVVRWQAGSLATVDLERTHSWVAELADVPPVEMIECQVVNAIVPFLFCSRLQPSLECSAFPDRYVVNVAAVEGQFERDNKLSRHPHTNMAKASLNMLTRTSAASLAERGIHMVAVDPGWVSHEGPPEAVARATEQGFSPPLEMVDAAARVLHPVVSGVSGHPLQGVLLKDFQVVPW